MYENFKEDFEELQKLASVKSVVESQAKNLDLNGNNNQEADPNNIEVNIGSPNSLKFQEGVDTNKIESNNPERVPFHSQHEPTEENGENKLDSNQRISEKNLKISKKKEDDELH